MSEESFICGTCSVEHPGLPTDYGFGLPDDVYGLSYLEKYRRSRSNADLCTLDDQRHFIRGVLSIPIVDSDEAFGLGIWVEVTKEQHDLYFAGFHDDLSDNPLFSARIANDIPGFDSAGLPVDVQFRSGNDRPAFVCPKAAGHLLAREQQAGITRDRQHDILDGFGFFGRA